VDLSGYFQTTATLAPVLLVGVGLLNPYVTPVRTWRQLGGRVLRRVVPPFLVVVLSLSALAWSWPDYALSWLKWIVFYLLALQMASGLMGTAGAHPGDIPTPRWLERLLDRRNPQPHSQPHKPEPTGPDRTTQPDPPSGRNRTIPGHSEPDQTAGRHS
jgi:hypothetical protein